MLRPLSLEQRVLQLGFPLLPRSADLSDLILHTLAPCLLAQEIFELEVFECIQVITPEMNSLHEILGLIQLFLVAASKMLGFELLQILSKQTRGLVLILEPHIGRHL